jgi:two-component system response regulator
MMGENMKEKTEILLVESNPNDAKLMVLAFQKYKVIESGEIHIARDGMEALQYLFGSLDGNEVLLNHHPRLIILDLRLPKISGLDVLKKIKSHIISRNIPIIVLSGSDKKTDWLDVHTLGVDSYLCKSQNLGQIIEAAGWAILEDTSVSYQ